MLGGRTNHWGRISLRFGPRRLPPQELDGLGDDWPITYDDVKPYYDKIDQFIGIFGANLPTFRNEPDGIFLPPPTPRCYELLIKKACDKLNVPSVPSRLSILTQPLNGRAAVPLLRPVRPRLRDALELLVAVGADPAGDEDRPAEDHHQRDGARGDGRRPRAWPTASLTSTRHSTRDNHVRARIVVLAASACESARILLNSKSSKFPQGLGNSSGVVGKYLTDSTGASVRGFIPALMDGIAAQRGRHRRHAPVHAVVAGQQEAGFPARLSHRAERRAAHAERRLRRRHPQLHADRRSDRHPQAFGGYGKELKNDYRRLYGATVNFAGRGEMIPNKDTYCEIDPTVVDKWGIPVLRFHFKWSDYEYKQAKHMQETFRAIITEMGGTPMSPMPTAEQGYGIAAGGRIIHEVGVTRMGNDPSTSVLNKYCQAHDAKNVFVADAGPFVSQADKNCTWTILALAMRTAEYIAEQRKSWDGL